MHEKTRRAFAPEMLAFYIAMLIPVVLGYALSAAWVSIVSGLLVILGFLIIRYIGKDRSRA